MNLDMIDDKYEQIVYGTEYMQHQVTFYARLAVSE